MEYVRFGNTGLKVSHICLGCMSYGKPLKVAAFSEPWKSCWKALDKAAPGQGHSALIQAAGP